jgi:hypothetical protein
MITHTPVTKRRNRFVPATARLLFGLFCCASATALRAAPEDPPKPATLRFLFLDETAGSYVLKTDKAYRPVSASPYTISPPFAPADWKPLQLYKQGTVRDAKTGELPRVKVATITPPASTTAALVIITPRPPSPDTPDLLSYNVEYIDSAASSFPGGSIRILNRGRVDMAARLSNEQIVAEPGSIKIVSPVADQRGRLRVMVAVQTPEKWKLIDDNIVFVMPDIRVTGVLVYSPSGLKFRFGPDLLAERGDPPPSHVWLTYTDSP